MGLFRVYGFRRLQICLNLSPGWNIRTNLDEEVGGVLKWAGRVTGVASVGNNLYKSWNERKTNGWQAALHFTEAVGQAGFMIFGGEEAELAWNLVSDGVDIGIDYYNHSHGKE